MPRLNARPASVVPNLSERIDQLSAKRQEIIRPILEHPREYVLLSVRAIAQRLQTDPATIVRIVRGLGFPSYRNFQRHLHDLSIAFATSLDTMQTAARPSGMQGQVRHSVEGAQQAKAHGAYCVGIADTYLSPLARKCNEVFLTSIESTSFGASYVAPIALVNALLAACGQYRRSKTLALVKQAAEEQRRGFRWYTA